MKILVAGGGIGGLLAQRGLAVESVHTAAAVARYAVIRRGTMVRAAADRHPSGGRPQESM